MLRIVRLPAAILFLGSLFLTGGNAMAIERRAYEVLESDDRFELREYESAIVAETIVAGDLADVGSDAFRTLYSYITGANQTGEKISMTAPVTQGLATEDPASAPSAAARGSSDRYRVQFMMPSAARMESLPRPRDARVQLRREPARRYAVVRYSGFWSRDAYERHLIELRDWMRSRELDPAGPAVWARYDPPFMPWFLRRNEVLIPLASGELASLTSH